MRSEISMVWGMKGRIEPEAAFGVRVRDSEEDRLAYVKVLRIPTYHTILTKC